MRKSPNLKNIDVKIPATPLDPETIIILDATFNRKCAREFRAISYTGKGGGGRREEGKAARFAQLRFHAGAIRPPPRQRSLSEGYIRRDSEESLARNAGSRLDVDVSITDRTSIRDRKLASFAPFVAARREGRETSAGNERPRSAEGKRERERHG